MINGCNLFVYLLFHDRLRTHKKSSLKFYSRVSTYVGRYNDDALSLDGVLKIDFLVELTIDALLPPNYIFFF